MLLMTCNSQPKDFPHFLVNFSTFLKSVELKTWSPVSSAAYTRYISHAAQNTAPYHVSRLHVTHNSLVTGFRQSIFLWNISVTKFSNPQSIPYHRQHFHTPNPDSFQTKVPHPCSHQNNITKSTIQFFRGTPTRYDTVTQLSSSTTLNNLR